MRPVPRVSAITLLAVPLLVAAGYLVTPPSVGCACYPAGTFEMIGDLRNLVSAEEFFFADNLRYSRDVAALKFTPSTGVAVSVEAVSDSGFRARATWLADSAAGVHARACVVWYGDSTLALEGLRHDAEPRCLRPGRPLWRFGSPGPPTWYR